MRFTRAIMVTFTPGILWMAQPRADHQPAIIVPNDGPFMPAQTAYPEAPPVVLASRLGSLN